MVLVKYKSRVAYLDAMNADLKDEVNQHVQRYRFYRARQGDCKLWRSPGVVPWAVRKITAEPA